MVIMEIPLLVNVSHAMHRVRHVKDRLTTIEQVDLQTGIYSLTLTQEHVLR